MKGLISLLIIVFFSINISAQVTIGSGEEPGDGSLLDLKETAQVGANAHKGLGLPRVGLSSSHPTTPAKLSVSIGGSGDWDMEEHIGLMVYNVTESRCLAKGAYVWDGEYWNPLKGAKDSVLRRTQDSLALVVLYNSTNGPGWKNNTNWLSAQPINTWYGVTTGYVTKCVKGEPIQDRLVSRLNLGSNNLTGNIPVELGNLTYMMRLDLSFNSLTGDIPAELGDLTNLTHLLLDDNQLTGGIPPELGNLAVLTTLDLNTNNLTGSIPTELGNLIGLTDLVFSENKLTGSIPAELGNLTKLQFLFLDKNQLTGSIPAELGKIQLMTLTIDENQLAGALPASWLNIRNSFLCPQNSPGGITINPDPWTNWQCP